MFQAEGLETIELASEAKTVRELLRWVFFPPTGHTEMKDAGMEVTVVFNCGIFPSQYFFWRGVKRDSGRSFTG